MEEFFLKLGLMTQKNHTELIQTVDGLRMSIEALTKEIAKLNSKVVESNTDLSDRISSLVDATKEISTLIKATSENQSALNEKLSTLMKATSDNRNALAKGIFSLANQTTVDNRALKESLENLEELLRLMAANQVMNLVDK